MLEFCPECNNLLRRKIIDGWNYLACGCGYKKKMDMAAVNPRATGTTNPRARYKTNPKPKISTQKKKPEKPVHWDPPDALILASKIKDAPWKKGAGVGTSEPSPIYLKMIQDRLDSRYYNCSKCSKFMSTNQYCTLHERNTEKKSICKSFTPLHAGFGAKKSKRQDQDKKRSSASIENRRCSYCVYFMKGYCHAHKKRVPSNGAPCDQYDYIYERSEEFINKK